MPAAPPAPDFDPLALEHQVCFPLYAASRALTAAYRPLLAPLGLTYPQYLVMLVLWERGTVPVGVLGAALHLDSGTLSPLLKRLEAAGLVERRRSTEDERVVHAQLTTAGRELRAAAQDVPRRIAETTGLDLETLALLRRACDALLQHTDDREADPA